MSPLSGNEAKDPAKIPQRNRLLNEILTTEESFVEGLEALETLYMIPMSTSKHHGRPSALKHQPFKGQGNVWGALTQIKKIHETELLQPLRKLIQSHDLWSKEVEQTMTVADLFIHFAPLLTIYTSFVKTFSTLDPMISEKINSDIDGLATYEREVCQQNRDKYKNINLALRSLLITPIQRPMRYVLFLNDLVKPKYTAQGDPRLGKLLQAQSIVKRKTDEINKAQAQAENSAMLLKKKNELKYDNLYTQGREYLGEGTVGKVWMKLKKKLIETQNSIRCVVFNDLILFGRIGPATGMQINYEMKMSADNVFSVEIVEKGSGTYTQLFDTKRKNSTKSGGTLTNIYNKISAHVKLPTQYMSVHGELEKTRKKAAKSKEKEALENDGYILMLVDRNGLPKNFHKSNLMRKGKGQALEEENEFWAVRHFAVFDEGPLQLTPLMQGDGPTIDVDLDSKCLVMPNEEEGLYNSDELPNMLFIEFKYEEENEKKDSGLSGQRPPFTYCFSCGIGATGKQAHVSLQTYLFQASPMFVKIKFHDANAKNERCVLKITYGESDQNEKKKKKAVTKYFYFLMLDDEREQDRFMKMLTITQEHQHRSKIAAVKRKRSGSVLNVL